MQACIPNGGRVSRFCRIRRVDAIDSTNEEIARILGEPETAGLTLVADFQKRGAGRKGRAWIAPPGSALLFTTALPEPLPSADLWCVPFWIALAVQRALTRKGLELRLQWPNDLLLDGRKVAGILCVSRVAGESAWVGCGVGINVIRPEDPRAIAGISPPPAFLSDAAAFEREEVLQAILRQADACLDELRDPVRIAAEWESGAQIPGARYRIALDAGGEPFDATALRLLPGGALLVDDGNAQREITLADARVLRE